MNETRILLEPLPFNSAGSAYISQEPFSGGWGVGVAVPKTTVAGEHWKSPIEAETVKFLGISSGPALKTQSVGTQKPVVELSHAVSIPMPSPQVIDAAETLPVKLEKS